MTKKVSAIEAEIGRCKRLVVTGEVRFILSDGVLLLDYPRQVLQAPPVEQDGHAVEWVTRPTADLDHFELNSVHLSSLRVPLALQHQTPHGLVTARQHPDLCSGRQ